MQLAFFFTVCRPPSCSILDEVSRTRFEKRSKAACGIKCHLPFAANTIRLRFVTSFYQNWAISEASKDARCVIMAMLVRQRAKVPDPSKAF